MNKILSVVVLLAAIMFLVTGLRWLVAPAGIVPMFGLTLAEGVGLSSQVGDMSAFFLTLASCMLHGADQRTSLLVLPSNNVAIAHGSRPCAGLVVPRCDLGTGFDRTRGDCFYYFARGIAPSGG